MGSVDDYLGTLAEADRAAYRRVLEVATSEVPDAEQGTSYGMAALRYRGKPLLGFQAARSHLSLFPFSPQAIDAARAGLEGFVLSKGTLRFDADRPVPDPALRALVRARATEIDGERP